MNQQSIRLGIHTLDPRTLYPTVDNVKMVKDLIQKVQRQLEEDRERYSISRNANERNARNETLDYLALLNDWVEAVTSGTSVAPSASGSSLTPSISTANGAISSTGTSTASSGNNAQSSGGTRANTENTQTRPSNPFDLRSTLAIESSYPVNIPEVNAQGIAEAKIQQKRCIYDQQNGIYYVLIKSLRGTIYGQVNAYQEGRMASTNTHIELTNRRFAIKIYEKKLVKERKSRDGRSVQENPLNELGIQQYLTRRNIPFVMPLVACLESTANIYAVFPFITGGELFDYVSNEAPIPEGLVRYYLNCWIDAVEGCHVSGVCHRDISLENFLLGGEGDRTPFLIDFGLATIMKLDQANQKWLPIKHTGAVGKHFYMAPEVFNGNAPYDGEAVDVWSLGSCLFICLFAVPLYESPCLTDARFKTALVDRRLDELIAQWGFHASAEALDLVKRMYDINPATRIKLSQIRSHPFMNPKT